MKKKSILFSTASAIIFFALASCSKMEQPSSQDVLGENSSEGDFVVNIECGAPSGDGSRTEFTDDGKIRWATGDVIYFMQRAVVDGSWKTPTTSTTLTKPYTSVFLTTSKFKKPDEGTDSWYCSSSPKPATSVTRDDVYLLSDIVTPDIQKPTPTGYDSSADLLISKYVKNLTAEEDGKYKLQFEYIRMISIGKMKIVKLPSSSEISSVIFSAIKGGNGVQLAGTGRYNYNTGEREKVEDAKIALTLDYSEQNITANEGMTAYFTCYPFELGSEDSFTVKVTTKAGEVFEKVVTLTDAMIAKLGGSFKLAQSRATQFTVDMSTAKKTCTWLSLSPYSSGSYVPTIDKTYAGLKGSDIASVKWCTADMATFSGITDFDTYIESNGTVLSDAGIANLNSNKTQILSKTGTIDTEYAFIVKATNNSGQAVILTTTARTDWFKLALVKRSGSNAGVQIQITAINVSTQSRAWRIVPTSTIEGISDLESYFSNTLKPGLLNTTYVDGINAKKGAVYPTNTAKYHTGSGSTTADMVAGTNYTILAKFQNERGETAFRTASATAN